MCIWCCLCWYICINLAGAERSRERRRFAPRMRVALAYFERWRRRRRREEQRAVIIILSSSSYPPPPQLNSTTTTETKSNVASSLLLLAHSTRRKCVNDQRAGSGRERGREGARRTHVFSINVGTTRGSFAHWAVVVRLATCAHLQNAPHPFSTSCRTVKCCMINPLTRYLVV